MLVGPAGHGWAAHQGPEVDGTVTFAGTAPAAGELVRAEVVGADGPDLEARLLSA